MFQTNFIVEDAKKIEIVLRTYTTVVSYPLQTCEIDEDSDKTGLP